VNSIVIGETGRSPRDGQDAPHRDVAATAAAIASLLCCSSCKLHKQDIGCRSGTTQSQTPEFAGNSDHPRVIASIGAIGGIALCRVPPLVACKPVPS